MINFKKYNSVRYTISVANFPISQIFAADCEANTSLNGPVKVGVVQHLLIRAVVYSGGSETAPRQYNDQVTLRVEGYNLMMRLLMTDNQATGPSNESNQVIEGAWAE